MRTERDETQGLRERICRTVEARRAELRIEPADLARAAEMDLSQLSKLRRGKGGASVYALERIAKALGWTLVDLFAAVARKPHAKKRLRQH